MTTADSGRRGRGRSETKRLAILDAAQELFVAHGFDVASVDAISARAEVSKRTVYDHFGDKENIYTTVVERSAEKVLVTVVAALEDELPSGCDLRDGLLAFVRRVATDTFASSAYVEFRSLVNSGAARRRVPGSIRNKPKELFIERMEKFAAQGAIRTDNPSRAAEHFIALTMLLAQDIVAITDESSWDAVDSILVDGVDAFIRAYT
ncbi:TetR/AcrR family transcriptional regulator [Mycobacterium sp. 050128]|uniref:TetR/AcrR family transcriptional regulator n=1 Tax=Mycobacterium sp. 050128 TaxID=3096112 RepID=UPI002EDAFF36